MRRTCLTLPSPGAPLPTLPVRVPGAASRCAYQTEPSSRHGDNTQPTVTRGAGPRPTRPGLRSRPSLFAGCLRRRRRAAACPEPRQEWRGPRSAARSLATVGTFFGTCQHAMMARNLRAEAESSIRLDGRGPGSGPGAGDYIAA